MYYPILLEQLGKPLTGGLRGDIRTRDLRNTKQVLISHSLCDSPTAVNNRLMANQNCCLFRSPVNQPSSQFASKIPLE